MEITSKPETVEVRLRDLDVRFIGEASTITLRPEDDLEIQPDTIVVRFHRSGEELTFERQHILWRSLRTRTINEPVKK